jgi:hypothetical protein
VGRDADAVELGHTLALRGPVLEAAVVSTAAAIRDELREEARGRWLLASHAEAAAAATPGELLASPSELLASPSEAPTLAPADIAAVTEALRAVRLRGGHAEPGEARREARWATLRAAARALAAMYTAHDGAAFGNVALLQSLAAVDS